MILSTGWVGSRSLWAKSNILIGIDGAYYFGDAHRFSTGLLAGKSYFFDKVRWRFLRFARYFYFEPMLAFHYLNRSTSFLTRIEFINNSSFDYQKYVQNIPTQNVVSVSGLFQIKLRYFKNIHPYLGGGLRYARMIDNSTPFFDETPNFMLWGGIDYLWSNRSIETGLGFLFFQSTLSSETIKEKIEPNGDELNANQFYFRKAQDIVIKTVYLKPTAILDFGMFIRIIYRFTPTKKMTIKDIEEKIKAKRKKEKK